MLVWSTSGVGHLLKVLVGAIGAALFAVHVVYLVIKGVFALLFAGMRSLDEDPLEACSSTIEFLIFYVCFDADCTVARTLGLRQMRLVMIATASEFSVFEVS